MPEQHKEEIIYISYSSERYGMRVKKGVTVKNEENDYGSKIEDSEKTLSY